MSDHLQSLAAPLNQTSFAKAVRLGVESTLDAAATGKTEDVEMALRWYRAAERYVVHDNYAEVAILNGFGDMLRAFNIYV